VNAITLITRMALEEERTECGNMSFEQNLQEKLLALTDRVRDETMVGLGVRFEDKGGKSTWKWDIGFGSSASQGVGSAASLEVVAPYLDAFTLFWDQVRTAAREGAPKEKFLELADRLRDETMVDLGVRFEDKGGKSTWKLDDPKVLQRERDERIMKDKEKLLQKEVARRELEEKKQKAREQKLQRKQQQKAGQKNLDN
jgi:hypothetical protein